MLLWNLAIILPLASLRTAIPKEKNELIQVMMEEIHKSKEFQKFCKKVEAEKDKDTPSADSAQNGSSFIQTFEKQLEYLKQGSSAPEDMNFFLSVYENVSRLIGYINADNNICTEFRRTEAFTILVSIFQELAKINKHCY